VLLRQESILVGKELERLESVRGFSLKLSRIFLLLKFSKHIRHR
jgi:hypothetical protein